MNRIDATFARLKKNRRKALIGYITAGFPDKKSLAQLIPLLENSGVDILEIGVPFSDPIADGPTIQASSQIALKNGATLDWILQSVRALRDRVHLPIILMSYCNPIYAVGIPEFFRRAKRCGVDGLIVPDLIPEEADAMDRAARREDINLIFLAAPTTPRDRLKRIAQKSRGFIYAVSVTGVTGARHSLPAHVNDFLKVLRRQTTKPIALGFGISTPAHVKQLAPRVDGVIIGSALIKQIEGSKRHAYQGAARYMRSLQHALNNSK